MKESEIKKQVAELKTRLPPETVRLRRRILALQRQTAADDTTNAESRTLSARASSLKERLRAACNHLFLAGYSGYRGSYSHDYDDGYRGSRVCMICGADEKGDDYAMLILRENGLMLDVDAGKGFESYLTLGGMRSAASSEPIEDTLRRYVGEPCGARGVSKSVVNPKHLIRTPAFYEWHSRLPQW